ncbi:murein biosynthesis integral membrane protein MurJ [uncultured Streptomyces sp.]|uniref:murein biosynthesis integral membrane protein MurJ n=1 Tax=uncultured Streptomyces sp. TaxID=174707 RepID=UPI00262DF627|nr:lipid II flippase MurJ [uncultured Streptomyces sp.]
MSDTSTGAGPAAGEREDPETAAGPPRTPETAAGVPRTAHGSTLPLVPAPGGRGPGPRAPGEAPVLGRFLARAAAATAALTVVGALLGLVRDQTVAHFFGAGGDSDAFLVAWAVPEMAATLLIEDGMALLLVPAFSQVLARREAARREAARRARPGEEPADPVREFVAATLPRLCLLLTCAAGLLLAGAPWAVGVLAPGLDDPRLAVDCTRLTAVTVLTFGITGYFSAALRAHGSFAPPAAVYVAYNVGIVGMTFAFHALWGVRAAAAGVAAGSVLMVLVQFPFFAARLRRHKGARGRPGRAGTRRRDRNGLPPLGLAVLAPVLVFVVSRQCQVLVERFLASTLPAGAISHLNYAQKVAQMPMVLSMMICTVTFPVVAQAMADGDRRGARLRVERDLALAALVVLLGTATVVAYAPQIIEVLFQRGAFDAQDTRTTAGVMRVYALGLLGHTLVGALGRPFFSAGRPSWYPAFAMVTGLVVTTGAGFAVTYHWGVLGIAAANAAGISTTAVLLLSGLGSRVVAIEVRAVSLSLVRLTVPAAAAGAAGWSAAPLTGGALPSLAAGCLLVPAVFVLTGRALRTPEVVHLLALTRQRFLHGH